MAHDDRAHDAHERFDAVTGLSSSERESSAADYFARVRWEPPVFDPERLSVSAFFAMVLDDAEGGDPGAG